MEGRGLAGMVWAVTARSATAWRREQGSVRFGWAGMLRIGRPVCGGYRFGMTGQAWCGDSGCGGASLG